MTTAPYMRLAGTGSASRPRGSLVPLSTEALEGLLDRRPALALRTAMRLPYGEQAVIRLSLADFAPTLRVEVVSSFGG